MSFPSYNSIPPGEANIGSSGLFIVSPKPVGSVNFLAVSGLEEQVSSSPMHTFTPPKKQSNIVPPSTPKPFYGRIKRTAGKVLINSRHDPIARPSTSLGVMCKKDHDKPLIPLSSLKVPGLIGFASQTITQEKQSPSSPISVSSTETVKHALPSLPNTSAPPTHANTPTTHAYPTHVNSLVEPLYADTPSNTPSHTNVTSPSPSHQISHPDVSTSAPPFHTPVDASNPVMNYLNPTMRQPSTQFSPVPNTPLSERFRDEITELPLPLGKAGSGSKSEITHIRTNKLLDNHEFRDSMRRADNVFFPEETVRRYVSEPPPDVDVGSIVAEAKGPVLLGPIPIPNINRGDRASEPAFLSLKESDSLGINVAQGINSLMLNVDLIMKRQEYSIAQNLVHFQTIDDRLDSIDFNVNQSTFKSEVNTDAIRELSDKVQSLEKSIGKQPSALFARSPLSSSHIQSSTPHIQDEINKLSNNIASLAAQMNNIQNSINNMEKSISAIHCQQPPTQSIPQSSSQYSHPQPTRSQPNPQSRRLTTPIPSRTPINHNPSSTPINIPFPRATTPSNSSNPLPHISRPTTPKKSSIFDGDFDPTANYKLGLMDGHMWFTNQVLSLPDDNISWWTRILTIGNWGPLNEQGNPSGCPFNVSILNKKKFLFKCIQQAFDGGFPSGPGYMPIPPTSPVPTAKLAESVKVYNWLTYKGTGPFPETFNGMQIKVAFYPGRDKMTVGNSVNPNRSRAPPPHVVTNIPPSTTPPPPRTISNNLPSSTPVNKVTDSPDSVYYEDLVSHLEDWKTVNRNKPSYSSMAKNNQFNNFSSQRPHSLRKNTTISSNKWVLTFHKSDKPTPSTRLLPHMVTDKINLHCKEYNIKAVLAEWTKVGNLSITFNYDSKEKNINNAAATIINILNPSSPNKSNFTKVVPWSKFVYPRVPCKEFKPENISSDEMIIQDDVKLWSTERLIQEVRNSHPLLKECLFVQEPSWTVHPDILLNNPLTEHANLCFAISDPDGSISKEVINSDAIIFSTKVLPTAWKEKVNLRQCTRCWFLGATHPSCPPKCRLCGSKNHLEENHNQSCEGCKNTGKPIHEIKSKDWICIHTKCFNCGNAHPADDPSCQARDEGIRSARARSRIPNSMHGQTILDSRRFRRDGPTTRHVHF